MEVTRDDYLQPAVVAESRAPLISRAAWARPRDAMLLWAVLGVGAGLHITWYLVRGSVWFDESLLALNILHRSPGELLQRLWFSQGAPWGFLEAEKLSVGLFGAGDRSLRLVPLLAALAALPVFWRVATLYLRGHEASLALAFFSLSPALILYSAESKQYSLDVLATLIAIWFGRIALGPLTWRQAAVGAASGALLVGFSHASMITLVACGLVAGIAAAARRDVPGLQRLGVIGATWGLFVGAFFLLAWPKLSTLRGFEKGEAYGIPFPPSQPGDTKILVEKLSKIAEFPFGAYNHPWSLLIALSAAVLAGVGAVSLLRSDAWGAAVLLAPIAAVAGVLALSLYPYGLRFLLFLIPVILLLVVAGTTACVRALKHGAPWRRLLAATAVAGAVYLAVIQIVSTTRLLAFDKGQDIRPVLERIRSEWRPGDTLYLQRSAQYPARYYAEISGVNRAPDGRTLWPVIPTYGFSDSSPALKSAPPRLLVGAETDPSTFARAVEGLRGEKRVWFVFGLVVKIVGPDIVGNLDSYLSVLDAAGHRRATVRGGAALAVLYDLRR